VTCVTDRKPPVKVQSRLLSTKGDFHDQERRRYRPTQPRRIERFVTGQPTQDGAGVKLTRVLTHDLQQRLDPFLMLDQFGSDDPNDYGAGFPDHPHRGFETVTYMIAGRMRHKDSAGNEGLLQNGGVQWMTAGRGVIHSEMPEQESGIMEGFQLWLNLRGADKMCPPWYRDIQSDTIPEVTTAQGVQVRVIAGQRRRRDAARCRASPRPRPADCRSAPGRADRPVRPLRDEHARATDAGGRGLPGRSFRLIRATA
jgi:redox-sensitive bicupin YhaK (pirin superfamily)